MVRDRYEWSTPTMAAAWIVIPAMVVATAAAMMFAMLCLTNDYGVPLIAGMLAMLTVGYGLSRIVQVRHYLLDVADGVLEVETQTFLFFRHKEERPFVSLRSLSRGNADGSEFLTLNLQNGDSEVVACVDLLSGTQRLDEIEWQIREAIGWKL